MHKAYDKLKIFTYSLEDMYQKINIIRYIEVKPKSSVKVLRIKFRRKFLCVCKQQT